MKQVCELCKRSFYGRKRKFCGLKCQRKQYRILHRKEIREKAKKHYYENKEEIREHQREYQKRPSVMKRAAKYQIGRYHREKDRLVIIPQIGKQKRGAVVVKYVPRDIRHFFTKEKVLELKNKVLNDCIKHPRKFLRGIKEK